MVDPERSTADAGQRGLEFEAFFHRHHRDLARLARTLTGNLADGDDLTGDAFAAVWQQWDRIASTDYPLAYVRRIVVNLAALQVRKAVRERRGTALAARMAYWFEPAPDVGVSVDLQAAVLRLPAGRRACVVLRHVLDLSEVEVAQTLGISVGTVKSQTSKGLSQLRVQLARADAEQRS